MAKILFIGDPHLKISRFNLNIQLLAWIEEQIEKYKPDLVINLGDTFDSHAVLRSEILYEFKKHVIRSTKTCPYWYVLGNHDFYKPNSSEYHALQSFNIENFEVIAEPTDFKTQGITVVPYMPDINLFPTNTQPIVVAHQTFVGADYGYYRPDVGVDADKISADLIVSGHVHKRQQFGKVYYPGTPAAHDLNDLDQVKGIDILDTETFNFKFIESPFPQYRSLSYTIAGDFSINDMHEEVEKTINSTDFWILKITGNKPEITEYMKSAKLLKLQKDLNLRVKPEFVTGNKIDKVKISSVSVQDIVKEYIERVYSGSLDKEMLKLKANDFINKSIKSGV